MTSLKCFLCSKIFYAVNEVIHHFKRLHPKCSSYSCPYLNCQNTYSNIESYRFHLKRHFRSCDFSKNIPAETIDLNQYCDLFPPRNENPQQSVPNKVNIENIRFEFLKKILKCYSNEKIPRSYAFSSAQDITKFYKTYLQQIEQNIKISSWIDNSKKAELIEFLRKVIKAGTVNSEYKFFKELKNMGYCFEVNYHLIHDERMECVSFENSISLTNINYSVGLFPLKEAFSALFTKTTFLFEIILYLRKLENSETGIIQNYIQSNHWKERISRYPDILSTLYLPLFIYFDDFEPNNPLGSHAGINKIGGVYVKFPCLPEHLNSKLQNIFIGMLFFSEDRRKFGNRRMFAQFIVELNELTEYDIHLEKSIEGFNEVKIIPTLILGDNLGLNSILGFTESFSSNFYCRFCKTERVKTKQISEEDCASIRTPASYEKDANDNEVKLSGVKELSVWNDLKHFHVTSNLSVDVMHDLLEGVCHYDLILILNSFIRKYEFFSLEQLNYRMLTFNFGPYSKNKPPIFNSDSLTKEKLKLSASEMWTLINNFSLIIGDLVSNCEEWSLYLLLREIVSIVCNSDCIQVTSSSLLKTLVSEHHELYKQIFGRELKPKFHNMTHYGRIMEQVGPLKHLSSIRFESFHQLLKKTAGSSNSRVNLLKTLFVKYQIKFASFLLNYEESCISGVKTGPTSDCVVEEFNRKFNIKIPGKLTNYIQMEEIIYHKHTVVQLGQYEDELPIFGFIQYIYITIEGNFFCIQGIKNHGFDYHFYAYRVEYENNFFAIPVESIKFYKTSYIFTNTKKNMYINWY